VYIIFINFKPYNSTYIAHSYLLINVKTKKSF